MYSLTELKKDTFIQLEGVPYRVIEYQHNKQGRGSAVVRVKLKNLADASVLTKTFKGSDKVEAADLTRIDMQYLYKNGSKLVLMDQTSYDQIEVDEATLKDQLPFLPEGAKLIALKFNNQIVGVDLPAKVNLKVSSTEPGLRGDTSGNALKPAVLETGASIRVPLFINQNDVIIVDTRDGSYVGRA